MEESKTEIREETGIEPYEFQKEALDQLQGEREHGSNAGVIVMPPGSGKTLISALDIKRSNAENILFLAHQKEILEQAKKEYEKVLPKKSMGLVTGREKEFNANIVFATNHTLSNEEVRKNFHEKEFDYIVIDECHHAQSDTYQDILTYFEPDYELGLTATPYLVTHTKDDILKVFGRENPSYEYSIDEAIEQNDLARFTAYLYKDTVEYEKNPEYLKSKALNMKLFLPERNQKIVDKWQEKGQNRKTIVFCRTIEHAKRMAKHFRQNDVTAQSVHSSLTDGQREKIIEKFRSGEIEVLTGVDIFNEGVDFPEVSCLVFTRPTSSKRIFLQQLGRGLRKAEGKQNCLVLDFMNEYDWQRMQWFVPNQNKVEFSRGECVLCGEHSNRILNVDGRDICADCRTEDIEVVTDHADIHIESEAVFNVAEQYEQFKLQKEGIPVEEIISDLQRVSDKVHGRVTMPKYQEHGRFSASFVQAKMGNWTKACEAAGLEPPGDEAGDVGRTQYLRDLNRVYKEHGNVNQSTYKKHGEHSIKPSKTHFGSWAGAKAALDSISDEYEVERKDVLREVRRLYKEHGEVNEGVAEEYGRFYLEQFLRFGDIEELVRETGVRDKDLLEDMVRVQKKVDGDISAPKYDEHGRYGSTMVSRRFGGSWNGAKKEMRRYMDEEDSEVIAS